MRKGLLLKQETVFWKWIGLSLFIHGLFLFPFHLNSEKNISPEKGDGKKLTFFLKDSEYSAKRVSIDKSMNNEVEVSQQINQASHTDSPRQTASMSKDELKRVVDSYRRKIYQRINEMREYPAYARRLRQEGIVRLHFTLIKNGTLKGSVKLVRGCEYPLLNNAGVRTIHLSNPFPSFPESVPFEELSFVVNLRYDLHL
jgi:TonB family protein